MQPRSQTFLRSSPIMPVFCKVLSCQVPNKLEPWIRKWKSFYYYHTENRQIHSNPIIHDKRANLLRHLWHGIRYLLVQVSVDNSLACLTFFTWRALISMRGSAASFPFWLDVQKPLYWRMNYRKCCGFKRRRGRVCCSCTTIMCKIINLK